MWTSLAALRLVVGRGGFQAQEQLMRVGRAAGRKPRGCAGLLLWGGPNAVQTQQGAAVCAGAARASPPCSAELAPAGASAAVAYAAAASQFSLPAAQAPPKWQEYPESQPRTHGGSNSLSSLPEPL
eukprot:scaffold47234_cov18-Tisochrysis_lutea.AAC.2